MEQTLAILILSFNKPERTARAVRETLELVKNWSTPHTLTLVHNGSLPHHSELLRKEFPNIEHLVLEHNLGFSGGMNAGFRQVFKTSTWTLALSNDCALLNEPESSIFSLPALVAPRVFRRKSGQVESCGGYCHWQSAQLRHARSEAEFDSIPPSRRYIPGSCFLIHRDVFEKTKGFDESLHTYWEDVDLSLRAQRLGFPLKVANEWQTRHDIGRTCHGDPLYTLYYFQRNRIRMMRKYAPWFFQPWTWLVMTKDFFRIWRKLIDHRIHDRKYLLLAIQHGFRTSNLPDELNPPMKGRAQINTQLRPADS